MFEKNITLTGITPLEEYPISNFKKYYKECLENDVLYVPLAKPAIKCIDSVNVNICIENHRIIDTVLGPKLIINGFKNIKVIYTADNCENSLHSSHWCIPFCEFILLKDLCVYDHNNVINYIFVGVENVCVKYYCNKFVDMSTIFVICPQLNNCNCFDDYNGCNNKPHNNPDCTHEKKNASYNNGDYSQYYSF